MKIFDHPSMKPNCLLHASKAVDIRILKKEIGEIRL